MRKDLKNQKGFTLVELAIVLVIIGLILGAVFKGQDLIRSARIKQYYNKFIKGWEMVYNEYQDRTGKVLGDGTDNGGTASTEDGSPDATSTTAMNKICNKILPKVGLTPPMTNTNNCYQENMSGKYYSHTVTASLRKLNNHNVIYLTNVPTDIAIGIDTIVDGEADNDDGTFQQYPASSGSGVGGWPDPSSTNYVNCIYILD